jgi:hypothetical protein
VDPLAGETAVNVGAGVVEPVEVSFPGMVEALEEEADFAEGLFNSTEQPEPTEASISIEKTAALFILIRPNKRIRSSGLGDRCLS